MRKTIRLTAVTLLAASVTFARPAGAADAAKGKALFAERCAFCHGMAGHGDGIAGATLQPPPTNFTAADTWKKLTPELIKSTISDGRPGTAMVAFKATLSPEQIDDVAAHILTFKPAP